MPTTNTTDHSACTSPGADASPLLVTPAAGVQTERPEVTADAALANWRAANAAWHAHCAAVRAIPCEVTAVEWPGPPDVHGTASVTIAGRSVTVDLRWGESDDERDAGGPYVYDCTGDLTALEDERLGLVILRAWEAAREVRS